MLRTISIKLRTNCEQSVKLKHLQQSYINVCNKIVPSVIENRCWNRVALHNLVYSNIRANSSLGSQMVCNAIYSVCKAYKAQNALNKIRKDKPIPTINFTNGSVHFDKRTYTIKNDKITLYTLDKRICVDMALGKHQTNLLKSGISKEAELIYRNDTWFFNLVIEIAQKPISTDPDIIIGVDVGENNIAAISTNSIYGGGNLKHRRDKYLALRRRLQSNGSKSAKQLLKKISGREQRFVKHTNHVVSKSIVQNAINANASKLVMENLTHIRANIKAGKRVRSRLHRWSFRQLQTFVEYKAIAYGITVEYVDPAYSSQTCSLCHELGSRKKNVFKCSCGFQAHADLNASQNLAWIGSGNTLPMASVNKPNVGGNNLATAL